MPQSSQRGKCYWRGVQSPTDSPLCAFYPSPELLFFGRSKERKATHITEIPRHQVVELFVLVRSLFFSAILKAGWELLTLCKYPLILVAESQRAGALYNHHRPETSVFI
jgi:hypothetical protein